MKRHFLRFFCCALFLVWIAMPGVAVGQQSIPVQPHEWLRFRISGTNNGYLYTPWYHQGSNQGFAFLGSIGGGGFGPAGLYPNPGPGFTPDPNAGLIPLHQWSVFQSGRVYIFYSVYYGNYGGSYRYDGIAGYVYPSNTEVTPLGFATKKVSSWFSQTRGLWYGIGEPGVDSGFELPPNNTYVYQGIVFRLVFPFMTTRPNGCTNVPGAPGLGELDCTNQSANVVFTRPY